MILVDTSVWIEYLQNRPPYSQILRHHLEIGNVVTIGVIFAELLQGARGQREVDTLLAYYSALPHIESGNEIWLEAGMISHSAKALARGIGQIDLAIISAARKAGAKIWSRDKKLLSLLNKEEIFHAKK